MAQEKEAGTIEKIALELQKGIRKVNYVYEDLETLYQSNKDDLAPDMLKKKIGVTLPASFTKNTIIPIKLKEVFEALKELNNHLTNLLNILTPPDKDTSSARQSRILGATIAVSKIPEKIFVIINRMNVIVDEVKKASNGITKEEGDALKDSGRRLLDYIVVSYLEENLPTLAEAFNLLGIIDKGPKTKQLPGSTNTGSGGNTAKKEAFIAPRFYPERIPQLFTSSLENYLISIASEWGGVFDPFTKKIVEVNPALVTEILLQKIYAFILSQIPQSIKPALPEGEYKIEIGDLTISVNITQPDLKIKWTEDPPIQLTAIMPAIGIKYEKALDEHFAKEKEFKDTPWKLSYDIAIKHSGNLDLNIQLPSTITNKSTAFNGNLDIKLGLVGEQKKPNEMVEILSVLGGARLQAKRIEGNLSVKASVDSSGGSFQPSVQIDLKGGKLVFDFSQGDGFIQEMLKKVKFESEFNLGMDWDPGKGLSFRGDAGAEIMLPIHIDLSIIKIDGLYFKFGIADNTPLQLGFATKFTTNLGPLKAVIDKIGFNSNFSFPKELDGILGLLDLGFGFKPPKGTGLSINAGIVKGGGYLDYSADKKEYSGVLELTFGKSLVVKAFGIITTRMPDGTDGFSLLLIITAELGKGIQLGFGFTLTGIGGLVGLNRTMLPEPIRAGIVTGGINSIMFPADPIKNAPKILSDLRTYFPPAEGQFLIGPMVRIGWGTPAIMKISLGLIIEIPGNAAIIGIIRLCLPSEDYAILKINVGFIGVVEFDKKRLWFFASLYDSRILSMTLTGDMGLLMDYGDNPAFLLSVGGFHPLFTPPPLPFPAPRRIWIDVLRESNARISVDGYFAVTSNTVQFGARAELYFDIAVAQLSGMFAFDALFQFSPFKFIIQAALTVGVKVLGTNLLGIRLQLTLEGPKPWHANGTGTLSIDLWLFELNIPLDFDVTWGDAENATLLPIQVMRILTGEFAKTENWKARLPEYNNLLVSVRSIDSGQDHLLVHPFGSLQISQRAVPLNLNIDKVGNQKAEDAKIFDVTVASDSLEVTGSKLEENFAIGQFQELSNEEKLTRPSFQYFKSGIELSAGGRKMRSSKAVRRVVRYETIILDSNARRLVIHFFAIAGVLFNHFLAGAAASRSRLSHANRKSFVPSKPEQRIKVEQPSYVIANLADNRAISGNQLFDSEAAANDHMKNFIDNHPDRHGEIHVIPAFEAVMK